MYVYLSDSPAGLVVLNHREGGLLEGVQTFLNGLGSEVIKVSVIK